MTVVVSLSAYLILIFACSLMAWRSLWGKLFLNLNILTSASRVSTSSNMFLTQPRVELATPSWITSGRGAALCFGHETYTVGAFIQRTLWNRLKVVTLCDLMWLSFVTGAGINLRPLDSRLIWSRVSSESERFLMYRFCDSSVFWSISHLSFFSPFVAFFRMSDALLSPFPFRVICIHKRDIGIRFRLFILFLLNV